MQIMPYKGADNVDSVDTTEQIMPVKGIPKRGGRFSPGGKSTPVDVMPGPGGVYEVASKKVGIDFLGSKLAMIHPSPMDNLDIDDTPKRPIDHSPLPVVPAETLFGSVSSTIGTIMNPATTGGDVHVIDGGGFLAPADPDINPNPPTGNTDHFERVADIYGKTFGGPLPENTPPDTGGILMYPVVQHSADAKSSQGAVPGGILLIGIAILLGAFYFVYKKMKRG